MLKSHFNLQPQDEEEAVKEEEPEPEAIVEEEKVIEIIPLRILQKSEVSVRLSLLGKTAEGDGSVKMFCIHSQLRKLYMYHLFEQKYYNL